MRVNNKGGVTPRDRRLDRRKVATAAAIAAVLLFAASSQAAQVNLVIDSGLSTSGVTLEVYDSGDPATRLKLDNISASTRAALGGLGLGPDPSNEAPAWGWIRMDYVAGTSIEFETAETRVNFFGTWPWFPYRVGEGGPITSPPGGDGVGGIPGKLAQLGFEIYLSTDGGATYGEGFGFANIYDLFQNFGSAATGAVDGGPLLPNVGGTSYAASGAAVNALMDVGGTMDLFGAITDSFDLPTSGASDTPFPSPFAGNIVDFDGTTLTIPLDFHLDFVDDTTVFSIDYFGTLVAHVHVPEPSSIVMLGCGALGLVGCLIRARKRRA